MAEKDQRWEYVVRCDVRGCERQARYKVAASWTDGVLTELKTYALACEEHVISLYRAAAERHAVYRPRAPEALGPLTVYELVRGKRDRELVRAEAVEAEARAALEGGADGGSA